MSVQYVMIDNRILSNRYPLKIFPDLAWSCVHYHYRANNWINAKSIWGHKGFNKHVTCTLRKYNSIIKELSRLGLMSVDYTKRTQHVKTMYIAPVGWKEEIPIYPTGCRMEFTGINIRKSHTHFTQVPRPIYMAGLSELESDSRRLLLTLYHYDYEILKGVDPNAVCVIGEEVLVSRRLVFNMSTGAEHIIKMLEVLEDKGYISYRNTVITTEQIDMDRRLVSSATNFGLDQQIVLKSPIMAQHEMDRGRPPDPNITLTAAGMLASGAGEGADSP